MSWVALSLLAAGIWAATNLVDKYTLSRWVRDPAAPVLITAASAALVAIGTFAWFDVGSISGTNLLLVAATAIIHTGALLAYFRAVKLGDISLVVPALYAAPLFVALLEAALLGTVLPPIGYAAVAMMSVGAILVSMEDVTSFRFTPAALLALGSAFAWAVVTVIEQHLLSELDTLSVFAYTTAFLPLAALPVLNRIPRLAADVRRHGRRVLVLLTSSEVLGHLGSLAILAAMAASSATLANTLASVQPFFIIAAVLLISAFVPKLATEKLTGRTLTQRLLATALLVLGGHLLV